MATAEHSRRLRRQRGAPEPLDTDAIRASLYETGTRDRRNTAHRPAEVNQQVHLRARRLAADIAADPVRSQAMKDAVTLFKLAGQPTPLTSLLINVANGPDIPGGLSPAQAEAKIPEYQRRVDGFLGRPAQRKTA